MSQTSDVGGCFLPRGHIELCGCKHTLAALLHFPSQVN